MAQNDREVLEALVASAAGGDRTAQNTLIVQFWPAIRAVVFARVHSNLSHLGAEDITQEAAVRVLQKLPSYSWRNASAFTGWVRAIAESTLLDHARRSRAKKRDVLAAVALDEDLPVPVGASVESRVQHSRDIARLDGLLEGMDPGVRAAVVLDAMGYRYGEIAEMTGCTPEAARKRVSRGAERLEEMLEKKKTE